MTGVIRRKLAEGQFVKIIRNQDGFTAELFVPFLDMPGTGEGTRHVTRGSSESAVWYEIKRVVAETPPPLCSSGWLEGRVRIFV